VSERVPRVTIVTRLFSPEAAAAAFRLRALGRALVASGAEVRVITTRPPGGLAPDDPPGLSVSRWPVLRDDQDNVRGYLSYLSFDVPALVRSLASGRADVVVVEPPPTTGLVGVLAAAVRRSRLVYYAGDVWSDGATAAGASRTVVGLLRRAERRVVARADVVLAVSDGVAGRVRELGASQVSVVGNGVDTEIFHPAVTPVSPPGRPLLVYAGTMSEWQGVEVFVRAAALLREAHPDLRLVLVGQGNEAPRLRTLAAELVPGAVEVRPPVPPAEAARWLRSADVALVSIVPGRGYDFARPTKVYAAAAVGTPVVFAGVGAGAELVTREGLGVAAGHRPDLVAAAIDSEISRPRDDAGAAARRAAVAQQKYSLDAVAQRAAAAVLETLTDR
jgi:glycosyltransferase involved in cell wall biosynthesis